MQYSERPMTSKESVALPSASTKICPFDKERSEMNGLRSLLTIIAK